MHSNRQTQRGPDLIGGQYHRFQPDAHTQAGPISQARRLG